VGEHGIVCGSTRCPICEQLSYALIGPCDDCWEWFERKGTYGGRRRKRAAIVAELAGEGDGS
jgi:hypothetical protein